MRGRVTDDKRRSSVLLRCGGKNEGDKHSLHWLVPSCTFAVMSALRTTSSTITVSREKKPLHGCCEVAIRPIFSLSPPFSRCSSWFLQYVWISIQVCANSARPTPSPSRREDSTPPRNSEPPGTLHCNKYTPARRMAVTSGAIRVVCCHSVR